MLELLFQGFFMWIYDMILAAWNYFSDGLLDLMSMDFAYLESHISILPQLRQTMLAVGWALLIGNLVFQAVRGMLAGLGFDAEDPKLLFTRTFVFSFLLLASSQICKLCLDMTSRILDLVKMPDSANIQLLQESAFDGLACAWLLVFICGIIIIFHSFKLLIEMAERYFILSMLTITAPLAFGMGGSRSTSDIFALWCRMYGSMCLLMVLNVVFVKMLLSVLSTVPTGLAVLPWMVLALSIVKTAKKADAIVTRIGLNPAMTGDSLGKSLPGMLTYMVLRTAVTNAARTFGNQKGSGNAGKAGTTPGSPQNGRNAGGQQRAGTASGAGTANTSGKTGTMQNAGKSGSSQRTSHHTSQQSTAQNETGSMEKTGAKQNAGKSSSSQRTSYHTSQQSAAQNGTSSQRTSQNTTRTSANSNAGSSPVNAGKSGTDVSRQTGDESTGRNASGGAARPKGSASRDSFGKGSSPVKPINASTDDFDAKAGIQGGAQSGTGVSPRADSQAGKSANPNHAPGQTPKAVQADKRENTSASGNGIPANGGNKAAPAESIANGSTRISERQEGDEPLPGRNTHPAAHGIHQKRPDEVTSVKRSPKSASATHQPRNEAPESEERNGTRLSGRQPTGVTLPGRNTQVLSEKNNDLRSSTTATGVRRNNVHTKTEKPTSGSQRTDHVHSARPDTIKPKAGAPGSVTKQENSAVHTQPESSSTRASHVAHNNVQSIVHSSGVSHEAVKASADKRSGRNTAPALQTTAEKRADPTEPFTQRKSAENFTASASANNISQAYGAAGNTGTRLSTIQSSESVLAGKHTKTERSENKSPLAQC